MIYLVSTWRDRSGICIHHTIKARDGHYTVDYAVMARGGTNISSTKYSYGEYASVSYCNGHLLRYRDGSKMFGGMK